MTDSTTVSKPGLPRRLMAMLYDTLLVIPVIGISTAVVLMIYLPTTGSPEGELVNDALPTWVTQVIMSIGCVGFFVLFWRKGGQTLGMQAWRIKLVPLPGKELSVWRMLLRCAGAVLSALPLGAGYLWCLVDRNRRYWHDYLSGTELILLPKIKKADRASAGAPEQ